MEFSEQAYKQLLEEIFVRFPSVQKAGFGTAYKPGLERMEAFCAALGHPERAFKSVHVAGTNGKGSVSSLLAFWISGKGLGSYPEQWGFPPRRFATQYGHMLRKPPLLRILRTTLLPSSTYLIF